MRRIKSNYHPVDFLAKVVGPALDHVEGKSVTDFQKASGWSFDRFSK